MCWRKNKNSNDGDDLKWNFHTNASSYRWLKRSATVLALGFSAASGIWLYQDYNDFSETHNSTNIKPETENQDEPTRVIRLPVPR